MVYDEERSARDAISALDGRLFMGSNLSVEVARPTNARGEKEPPRKGTRLSVTNLDGRTTWQDLKGICLNFCFD